MIDINYNVHSTQIRYHLITLDIVRTLCHFPPSCHLLVANVPFGAMTPAESALLSQIGTVIYYGIVVLIVDCTLYGERLRCLSKSEQC